MHKKRLQMQKRRAISRPHRHGKTTEAAVATNPNLSGPRINQYVCDKCGGVITTVDNGDGVTPFFLKCRATEDCPGGMKSRMYQVDQTLTPQFEWYKPVGESLSEEMLKYVAQGGLLIRSIETTQP